MLVATIVVARIWFTDLTLNEEGILHLGLNQLSMLFLIGGHQLIEVLSHFFIFIKDSFALLDLFFAGKHFLVVKPYAFFENSSFNDALVQLLLELLALLCMLYIDLTYL